MHPSHCNPCFRRDGILRRLVDVSAHAPWAVGLRSLALLAALVTTLVACSPGEERETQHAGEDAGRTTAPQETTTSSDRTVATRAQEDETMTTDPRDRWDYVALGDSLAAGVGARRGCVSRYPEPPRVDTGAPLSLVNLAQTAPTASQLRS